jgi:hypothetical protein
MRVFARREQEGVEQIRRTWNIYLHSEVYEQTELLFSLHANSTRRWPETKSRRRLSAWCISFWWMFWSEQQAVCPLGWTVRSSTEASQSGPDGRKPVAVHTATTCRQDPSRKHIKPIPGTRGSQRCCISEMCPNNNPKYLTPIEIYSDRHSSSHSACTSVG